MIIWIIGLSGAGKSTVSQILFKKIRTVNPFTLLLDGDVMRKVWGDSLGHDIASRYKNAKRISNLCKLLDEQGINVIASVLSLFPEWQKWNRENFKNYFQVFLDVDMEILKKRDFKGVYSSKEGEMLDNVVGIDIEFPKPVGSDLIIDNGIITPEKCVELIYEKLPLSLV